MARPWAFHGGVESATAGLVRTLIEHGHDVHLLTTGPQRAMAGLTVRRISIPPLPPAARLLVIAVLARAAMRRGDWDVRQSHERVPGADVYRAGEGCHRAYLAAMGGPRRRRLYHRVLLGLERRVLTRTPRIVALAQQGKREVEQLYGVPGARVAVVYNGVDLGRFHPDRAARDRSPARIEAGLADGAFTLLFVGSGYERKGLDTAIQTLASPGHGGSQLIVLGKGDPEPYRALAARLEVADRLVWLGPRPDVERWYAAADALVLPSRYEPFGNVHLEALASGRPVVSSTRAGAAEIIVEGANGAVRDPGDVRGIAEAITALRERPAGELAAACRRSAEPFTWTRHVRELTVVWRSAVTCKV